MSKIPEGWKIINLGNLGDIKFSNVDKKSYDGQMPVSLCNYMDVYKNEYIDSKIKFMPSTASSQEINNFKINKFDVLFTKDSETPDDIANSSVVVEELKNVICGYHLAIVHPDCNIAYGPFLSKQIKSDFVRYQFIIEAKGSTRFGLGLNSISKIKIPLPPLSEQKKISEILSSVDHSIEATEKLIAKLADLKKALMQELFTKGIGHTKFKDSLLGRIPEEWEVRRMKEVCSKIQDGTHFSPKSKTGTFKYITSKNIRDGFLDLSNCSYISEEEHVSIYKRCQVQYGDVLLTKDGVNVGNACINCLKEQFSLLSSVTILRGKNNLLSNEYLLQYLLSPIAKRIIKDSISGLAITRMTLTVINNLKIIFPPYPEQTEIASILSANDAKIEKARTRLNKLQDMKKGLMQDLLTGKVRT